MKSLALSIVFLFALASVAGAVNTQHAGFHLSEVPRFDGYVGTATDMLFVLALIEPDGETANRLWRKIGQKIGRFQVTAFDAKKEELTLKRSDGLEMVIRLVDSKVLAGSHPVPLSREAARAYALDLISSFLSAARQEHPERTVIVNPELGQMPEERRSRFVKSQEKLQKNGQFLTPFLLPDGRWGEAISGDEAKKLPPSVRDNLSEEDRREINLAWAVARAEALARGIPPREKTVAK